ncbi:MAG: SLC13 family permease [Chloroflexi bacterium]|nr:SLC13 family permease [Chloroflexota bacterium]
MWITLLIIFLPLTLVMLGRWRMDVAALLMMAALGLAQFFGWGILGKPQTPADAIFAIAGFSQPVIITLIGLFILTQALTANGMMQWMSQQMMRLGGGTEGRLIFLFAGSAALLSLLMNNVAVGALLLPGAMQVSRRTRLPPSKLLIPIAFGTALGGMATYFTTANIILSNLLINASPPQAGLDFRSFFPVGGLIALVGILYLAILGRHLLPSRQPGPEQMLARRSSAELERLYALGERLWLGRVAAHSPLVGQSLQQSRIGELLGIVVVAIWRKRQAIFNPSAAEVIQPGDMLLLVGNEQRVQRLSQWGIEIGREKENVSLSRFNVSPVEVVLAPHSSYEGKTLKALNFRRAYGFTAIALMRRGRSYRTDVGTLPLEAGDSLLMIGPSSRLRDLRANPEIILLEVEAPVPLVPRKRALFSLLLLLGAVAASVMGMPAYLAILSAASLALLLNLLPVQEAYRAIEWQVLFFIAGMSAASRAMVNTGLAALAAQSVVRLLTGSGSLELAGAVFLLSAALTQFMGSQTTAFVIGPIAISAALHLGLAPQPIALAAAIGCSASFLTPTSHPVNLIMMNPGNYRFGDFARVGLGLMALTFLTLLAGLVLFWHLS